jgi:hypothetical protein
MRNVTMAGKIMKLKKLSKKDFLKLYDRIFYHRFKIRMIAVDDLVFDAWTGAAVRNNLLYAADSITVKNTGYMIIFMNMI